MTITMLNEPGPLFEWIGWRVLHNSKVFLLLWIVDKGSQITISPYPYRLKCSRHETGADVKGSWLVVWEGEKRKNRLEMRTWYKFYEWKSPAPSVVTTAILLPIDDNIIWEPDKIFQAPGERTNESNPSLCSCRCWNWKKIYVTPFYLPEETLYIRLCELPGALEFRLSLSRSIVCTEREGFPWTSF